MIKRKMWKGDEWLKRYVNDRMVQVMQNTLERGKRKES